MGNQKPASVYESAFSRRILSADRSASESPFGSNRATGADELSQKPRRSQGTTPDAEWKPFSTALVDFILHCSERDNDIPGHWRVFVRIFEQSSPELKRRTAK